MRARASVGAEREDKSFDFTVTHPHTRIALFCSSVYSDNFPPIRRFSSMVLIGDSRMSRTDEVHRITENVYKSIMEQFNPCLRNFVSMGKTYEKALSSVTFAAKGYFDALVRMGELASESHGSKDLGDVLFQMAEVHRQIQMQLEDMLKSFHNELLTELEKKVELDARYLSAALKKYQMEHKSKGESLEKCQAELKKLRRKSQGKNASKYGDKEMQYVEAISCKQGDLDNCIAEGYRTALSEERRRYCFLVDRQCAVAKNSATYHGKGKDLLAQNIPLWQQACSDPSKLPERAMILAQQLSSASGKLSSAPGTLRSSPLDASKANMLMSDPSSGAKPLPLAPELTAFTGGLAHQDRLMGVDGVPLMNGAVGGHAEDYQQWVEGRMAQAKAPQQHPRQASDKYSSTLPVRKTQPARSKASAETRTLPRSSSVAAGLERERSGRTRVQAVFSHAAGDNATLLSFSEGDVITLLVPEARDGWHYGENEKNKMRGWFPFSYTRVLPDSDGDNQRINLRPGKSSSTGNLLEREDMALPLPPPDYGLSSRQLTQISTHSRSRPYSMVMPIYSQQALDGYDAQFPTSSDGKLISTV
ncbi:brain-specific angiogenesis inhibitor 1-associated protein 2 isoform X3 [Anguilla anguilla]|uniref:brain-specific angiogenesis inhibitor 1-associated protein 2 isoform X3 n=1 Tax=Anguilla anguilla TaxID=7936 RepID=UPI0015AD6150|nr:brain-specific angiogenesis inhibitor 1-associated protein 2 isoform X3 [Anguilla anguilla]